jgi:hypothetical protein
MASSAIVSRWASPSISGQYSSRLGVWGGVVARVTSRPSAFDRMWLRSLCALVTMVPSGSVIQAGGIFSPRRGGSAKAARQSKSFAHLLGFLALATFPLDGSPRAYARSPSSPRCVTSVAFSSSPIMDLTGYRQSETTEPSSICVVFAILHSPQVAQPRTRLKRATPDAQASGERGCLRVGCMPL